MREDREQPVALYCLWGCRAENLVETIDITGRRRVFLDPENLFWAILSRNGNFSEVFESSVMPLYKKKKAALDGEMRRFRKEVNLKAFYVNPTDECNLSCRYCYIPSSIRRKKVSMTEAQLDVVLGKIYKHCLKRSKLNPVVIFHGSEPLIVKGMLFKAISRWKGRIIFGIQTNATLLEQGDVEFIKNSGTNIGLSLDSSSEKINAATRHIPFRGRSACPTGRLRSDPFHSTLRAIRWFAGYDKLSVITTITKHNVTQLPQLVRFLHSMKVESILLNPVRITQPNAEALKPDNRKLTKHFIKAVDTAIGLSKRSGLHIAIGNFSNLILGITSPTARRIMCDITPCGGNRFFMAITAEGNMLPCSEFLGIKEFRAGNIFKDDIEDALRSPQFKRVRARVVEKIAECRACVYRNICGTPCPGEVHRKRKDMLEPSPYCEFYKKLIPYAFGLIAEGKLPYLFRKGALKNLEYEYNLTV